MRTLRVTTAGLMAVVLALVAAACGIRDDGQPRALPTEDVPFGLLEPGETTTTTVMVDPADDAPASVFLVANNNLLVERQRLVPSPVRVLGAVQALLQGATEEEKGAGLRTVIPSGTELLGVSGPEDRVVTIDLSDDLTSISGEAQRLALAQVVFTATSVRGVDRVLFEFDGEAGEIPDGSGELTARPVGRADFASFDPTAPTTTTAPPPPPAPAEAPPPSS